MNMNTTRFSSFRSSRFVGTTHLLPTVTPKRRIATPPKPPTRALNEIAMLADQYVSFDNAVDLVDYHFATVERLLKAVDDSTSFLAQEVAWIFAWSLFMNIVGSMRR